MTVVKTTVKGQIIIPAPLRRKYGIRKGSRVKVFDRAGEIIVRPLPDRPIQQGRGMFQGGKSALKELLRDRAEESRK